jgi:hypothetical protein
LVKTQSESIIDETFVKEHNGSRLAEKSEELYETPSVDFTERSRFTKIHDRGKTQSLPLNTTCLEKYLIENFGA